MRYLVGFLAVVLFALSVPLGVRAQSLQGMSCYDLWFERNQIFARNGYCFKTRKARAVFGAGCFAPYGRLSRAEQRRVDDIRMQERFSGCRQGVGPARPQPLPAPAPGMGGMSCNDLWYARNAIYARNGHCFKTRRGRAAFGRNCFAPYGRLGRADQREVNRIQAQERRMGCR